MSTELQAVCYLLAFVAFVGGAFLAWTDDRHWTVLACAGLAIMAVVLMVNAFSAP